MGNKENYYAKSMQADGHQPTVKEHLEKVSRLAEEFGTKAGCCREAKLAGQLHDFGKYSDAFQKRLRESYKFGPSVDHAICGASLLYGITKNKTAYRPVIEAINGHHRGLVDFGELKDVLDENLRSSVPVEQDGRFSALSGIEQYKAALGAFSSDFSKYRIPALHQRREPSSEEKIDENISGMLWTRMIFSCLVDADYSISACDENPDYLKETGSIAFDPGVILKELYSFREKIRKGSNADKRLNEIRDSVFKQCGDAGEGCEEGLFTLTAPTGVGKTLALLHFALRHCIATGKERIIIVLPFLTLTEQNADTYRNIFPELLEDHSQRDLDDSEREYAARWSAPFIVTTSVRFFESLFAHKPTDCRKLHHIANSVVVFDEAQSLPVDVTVATLQAVNELCRGYHCSMVFSTATQPDFDAIEKVTWRPKEILPSHRALYTELARTKIEWKSDHRTALELIAEEMADCNSVCAIVNLRKHARKLFEALKRRCSSDEVFYLTTDRCMEDRREAVVKIRERLFEGRSCKVVATQCIEAGVDLDFEKVYRAMGPLDSIIQAAGRCNRNGSLQEKGRVIVFKPDVEGAEYPGHWYEHAAQKVDFILKKHLIDIHDTSHIQEYYQLVYGSVADKRKLTDAISLRQYDLVDKQYQFIENRGVRVIVPCKAKEKEYREIRKTVLEHGITPFLMKKTANITVTVTVSRGREDQFDLIAERLCYSEKGNRSDRFSDFYILRPDYEKLYTDDMGLLMDVKTDVDPFW